MKRMLSFRVDLYWKGKQNISVRAASLASESSPCEKESIHKRNLTTEYGVLWVISLGFLGPGQIHRKQFFYEQEVEEDLYRYTGMHTYDL